MTPLCLVLLGLVGAEQVIDDFRYPDTEAARGAWVAKEGTPPVELTGDRGASALKVAVPFAADTNLRRTVIDRRVQLNLAAAGEFVLETDCDAPRAVAELTLYFRSGNGWYGSRAVLGKPPRQRLRFAKASFRTEGSPTGWHAIDGIRIAAWRGRAQNTSLRLRRLTAGSSDLALVVPGRSAPGDDPEVRTAWKTAELIGGMLTELGLSADVVEQSALAHGALAGRRLVVLVYNPRLADRDAQRLADFAESGGKMLVCYLLPRRLGLALGFTPGRFLKQQRPGQFAEIRFQRSTIRKLPEKVRQASWNILLAEPAAHNARVIGRWYDDAGRPTGHAAMLVSDRGAFLNHIVLSDDRPGKRRLLAAVLGHLHPPIWQRMARAKLDHAGRVGHCEGFEQVAAHVKAARNAAAAARLEVATGKRAKAEKQLAGGAYPEAAALGRQARRELVEAYLLAQTSPPREGRAMWNHSGTGAYPGDWDRSARELAAAGFNIILPNMLWAGRAHYASDLLPRSATFQKYGDQVAQCTAAAKRHGLEVHVWKVNYNLSGAPREFVEKLRREGRLQRTAGGEEKLWLCPSHPENQRLELESMLEVARKYPVAGLHFDYIRYPGRDCCYCEGCRRRFETDSRAKVAAWPGDCYQGLRKRQYHEWRCRQITRLVAAVHREAKKLRPEVKISAAVFGAYPDCRQSVGQDWVHWVEAGYLDFLCPMDYTPSDERFVALVESQLKLVGGRIAVYPGIGATASRSALSADRVVGQIHHARRLGAAGFTIFNFSPRTAGSIVPGVGRGAGAKTAKTPH